MAGAVLGDGSVVVNFLRWPLGWFIVLLLYIPIGLYLAFIASVLWDWFLVPFFNLPSLSVWQMFGVMLAVVALRPRLRIYKEERKLDWKRIAMLPFVPLFILALGAIIKFWILP